MIKLIVAIIAMICLVLFAVMALLTIWFFIGMPFIAMIVGALTSI